MTFRFTNPPAHVAVAPDDLYEEEEQPVGDERQAQLQRLVASFFVAAVLVGLLAAGVYFVSAADDGPPVTINVPPVPTVQEQPETAVPSFTDFLASSGGMALVQIGQSGAVLLGMVQQAQPGIAGVPYSPADSCRLLLHSLNIDPAALENWHNTPEADRASVAESCRWEVMP